MNGIVFKSVKPLTKNSSITHIVEFANISSRKFYKNKLKRIKDLYVFSADDFINIFKFSIEEFSRLNRALTQNHFKPIEGCAKYVEDWHNYEPRYNIKNMSREEFLAQDIGELELTVRAENCLRRQGVNTIKQLTNYTSFKLLEIPGLGPSSVENISEMMYLFGV